MSTAAVTLDMSKAQPIGQAAPVKLDMSKAQPISQPSQWDQDQEQAHQTRLSALAGLTGMPTINMTDEDKAQFEQGKEAGSASAAAVTAAATGIGSPLVRAALVPIVRRYGIKALEGAGLAAGYQLYGELKKVFEKGDQ